MRPPSSTVGVKHGHAVFLLFQGDAGRAAVVVLADGDEDLAAGQEAGFLAADGHDGGLGQDLHEAIALLRIELDEIAVLVVERFDQAAVAAEQVRQQGMGPVAHLHVDARLAPSWSTRLFDTSAILTSSITCWGAAMASMLTTFTLAGAPSGVAAVPPPAARAAYACARAMIWLALTASATVPETIRVSAAAWTCSAGSSANRRSAAAQRTRVDGHAQVDDGGLPGVVPQDQVGGAGTLAQQIHFVRVKQDHVGDGRVAHGQAAGGEGQRQRDLPADKAISRASAGRAAGLAAGVAGAALAPARAPCAGAASAQAASASSMAARFMM
jgi:hypothetical protein